MEEFSRKIIPLVERLNSFNNEEARLMARFINVFTDAVSFLGGSDIAYRLALNLDYSGLKANTKLLEYRMIEDEFNKRGVDLLQFAKEILSELLNMSDRFNEPLYSKNIEEMEIRIKEVISKVEDIYKPKDLEKVYSIIASYFDSMREEGGKGIISIVNKFIDELFRERQKPTRGRIDNIPWWKIAAIAVYIGVSLFLMYLCTKHYRKTGNLYHWSCYIISVTGGISLDTIKFLIKAFC